MKDVDETLFQAQLDAEQAFQEEQNARVEQWLDRVRGARMSMRERTDGWAEVMRPSNVRMLEGFTRMGWMPPQEERAATIKAALCEMGFHCMPTSGWPAFCYELDLIFVALPDRVHEGNIGHAALAKLVEQEADNISKARQRVMELSHQLDFMWAESECGSSGRNYTHLVEAEKGLREVAKFLKQKRQPARWRNASQRKFRVELAVKVSTLFEREFGQEAKPTGGSATRDLDEANDWTRFFQACALITMGERASPDRQAVLWEAFGNK